MMDSIFISFASSLLITVLLIFVYSIVIYNMASIIMNFKSIYMSALKKYFLWGILFFFINQVLANWTERFIFIFTIVSLFIAFYIFKSSYPRKKINKTKNKDLEHIVRNWKDTQNTMNIVQYSVPIVKKNVNNSVQLIVDSEIDYESIAELKKRLPESVNLTIRRLKKKINSWSTYCKILY